MSGLVAGGCHFKSYKICKFILFSQTVKERHVKVRLLISTYSIIFFHFERHTSSLTLLSNFTFVVARIYILCSNFQTSIPSGLACFSIIYCWLSPLSAFFSSTVRSEFTKNQNTRCAARCVLGILSFWPTGLHQLCICNGKLVFNLFNPCLVCCEQLQMGLFSWSTLEDNGSDAIK